ncbi:MAG: TatD family nuclease-associated radical SAM protein [Elusimicrobiota bacterium]
MSASYVYRYQDALYVNLTNRCPTSCVFCVKGPYRMDYRGLDLSLGAEPTTEQIMMSLREQAPLSELVFCGYGESTYRMPELMEVSRTVRAEFKVPVRLNTIGLGSLINGRDISQDLAACLDAVSISLNTADPESWLRLHRPLPEFRKEGFAAVLDFTRACVRGGLRTVATAVDYPENDLAAVEALAGELGAAFRLRPRLEDEWKKA